MKDAVSIQRAELLHPKVKEDFINFINDAEQALDTTFRIAQGLRTFLEQQALYDQGRTKPGKIVTKAKAGQSYHNYGLAVDLVNLNGITVNWNYDMSKLVPYADKYGIKWGGSADFIKAGMEDKPHFERNFGINWRTLLAKYNKGDFIEGTTYVNI